MLAKFFHRNNPRNDINNRISNDSDEDEDEDDDDLVHRTFREVSSSRLWSTSNTTSSTTDIDAHPGIENVDLIDSSPLDHDDDFDYDDDEDEGVVGETRQGIILPSSSIPTSSPRRNYYPRRRAFALLSCLLLAMAITIHLVHTSNIAKRNLRYEQFKSRIVQLILLSLGSSGDVENDLLEEKFADETSPQNRALVYLVDGDSSFLEPNDPTISTRLLQRYALVVFYYSTHGSNWISRKYWLTGLHECGWIFVICSDITNDGETAYLENSNPSSAATGAESVAEEDDDYSNYAFREPGLNLFDGRFVTGLSLYGQELHGTLPMEIALLEHLQVLDLGDNKLQGSIPPELRQLRRLKKLYLQNNMFEGDIDGIAHLPELKRLNLEKNRLSGTLSNEMGEDTKLEEVRLGLNQFNGNIPPSLLRSTTLTRLELYGNRLSGELIIQQSSYLEYLHLYDNKLSGQLPTSNLCHLSKSLVDIRLNNNSFVGKLLEIDCVMERLELLSLGQNMFTGPIPDTLGESTPRLREIHLHENSLQSTIPRSLFHPVNLTAALLGDNALTGSLTADIVKRARNLEHLYVNSNNMSGNLADFAKATDLSRLRKLRLEDNNFSGTIPELAMIEAMELLYLHNNSLTGTLDNLRSGVNLRKLKVSNNNLDGEVTSVLDNMKYLEVLSLNGNNLVGSRMDILRHLPNLKILDDEFIVPGS